MSVQFRIESNPTDRFVLVPSCLEPGESTTFNGAASYANPEEAMADAVAHRAECEDCAHYGCRPQNVFDGPETFVSMSNLDAHMTLARIGLDPSDSDELAGVCNAVDFHARTLGALALLGDDTGVPTAVDSTPGRARVVHAGEEPGSIEARLRDLHDLASEAVSLGRDIQWH